MAHILKPKPKLTKLSKVTGIPYRCMSCGKIQIDTGYQTSDITNCNHSNCHGDDIRLAGPLQVIQLVIYSNVRLKRRKHVQLKD